MMTTYGAAIVVQEKKRIKERWEFIGRAKRRRRFGFRLEKLIQSGIALGLPPHAKFYRALRRLNRFVKFLFAGVT